MALQPAASWLIRLLDRIVSRWVTADDNVGSSNIYRAFPIEFE